ncbi:MAG: hypothetical protein LBF87_02130 [Treponema sp.]|jgi:Zn-dependent peptidase ImmA (M78 family)|nr:hypothetical protein [Treponema sp.]
MRDEEFVIDNEKKKRIAKAFEVRLDTVAVLHKMYSDLASNIKYQYLAHIMRSMEVYFREKMEYRLFIISCEPYKQPIDGQKPCFAHYYQGQSFVIFYDKSLDERALRVHIAHELGHLFLIALKDISEKDKRQNVYEGTTEPLSSILGIFAISEKNDFYRNISESQRDHKDWTAILNDFVNLATPNTSDA